MRHNQWWLSDQQINNLRGPNLWFGWRLILLAPFQFFLLRLGTMFTRPHVLEGGTGELWGGLCDNLSKVQVKVWFCTLFFLFLHEHIIYSDISPFYIYKRITWAWSWMHRPTINVVLFGLVSQLSWAIGLFFRDIHWLKLTEPHSVYTHSRNLTVTRFPLRHKQQGSLKEQSRMSCMSVLTALFGMYVLFDKYVLSVTIAPFTEIPQYCRKEDPSLYWLYFNTEPNNAAFFILCRCLEIRGVTCNRTASAFLYDVQHARRAATLLSRQ